MHPFPRSKAAAEVVTASKIEAGFVHVCVFQAGKIIDSNNLSHR